MNLAEQLTCDLIEKTLTLLNGAPPALGPAEEISGEILRCMFSSIDFDKWLGAARTDVMTRFCQRTLTRSPFTNEQHADITTANFFNLVKDVDHIGILGHELFERFLVGEILPAQFFR